MPSAVDILSVIGRVRRAMPRNAEVMFLCDCLERLILNIGALKAEASTQAATVQKNVEALAKERAPFCENERGLCNIKNAPPARATLEVARLPRDAKIEISAIAVAR